MLASLPLRLVRCTYHNFQHQTKVAGAMTMGTVSCNLLVTFAMSLLLARILSLLNCDDFPREFGSIACLYPWSLSSCARTAWSRVAEGSHPRVGGLFGPNCTQDRECRLAERAQSSSIAFYNLGSMRGGPRQTEQQGFLK